jgi:heme-degrading monooxygenase HmoA
MFCTLTHYQAVPENLDEITRFFKVQYIPVLLNQPGFKDVYLLTRPDGELVVMNNWETKKQADDWFQNPEHQNIIFQLRPMLKSAVAPENYKVAAHSVSGT